MLKSSASASKGKFNKKIILDTSTLLYDALAFKAFKSADIYIPFVVLEEIDKFKRDMGEKGRNARHFNRCIDLLRQKASLTEGVKIEFGSYLFVHMNVPSSTPELDPDKADNRILETALLLQKQNPSAKLELITKDINLRIKADIFGIEGNDYDPDQSPDFESLYTGMRTLSISGKQMVEFQDLKCLRLERNKCYPNQYVVLKNQEGERVGLTRYDKKKDALIPIFQPEGAIWGVSPKNVEQQFAMDALLNDECMLVSLLGKAGTGKTLLALAAGLHKTLEENAFQKLLVSRPVFPMGRDIGYLPGDIGQKLNPWMQPIFDSIEFLMGMGKRASRMAEDLINQGLVNVEPLAYIRGRSIPNQYLIVDEAQNLTPHEIKTVLTRAGQGTKVILTGDCYQIDNPYVDSVTNGLTFSVEKFKSEILSSHVSLTKGERSDLAERAANIL